MKRALLVLLGALGIAGVGTAAIGCSDDTADGGGGAGGATNATTGTSPAGPGSTTSGTGSSSASGGTTSSTAAGMFDCTAPEGNPPSIALDEIASGLDSPILVKSAPDNFDRLYIVEQTGAILIWENDAVLPTPFLDVSGIIQCCGEQGLLGLAFHPDYANNGRFFIHYSDDANSNASTVFEYQRSQDPLVADPTPVQLVIQHPTAESNHNGGSIEFGNDGYLYIAWGDGGGGGDPECDAQNPDNLWGKIVRLDVNGTPDGEGYPAAPGNPGGSKIFHNGLRNPWRVSFDPCNGDLWIGDVGQGQWEEVSFAAQAAGALNFGWPFREGMHDFNNNCPGSPMGLTEPIAEYQHQNGRCSITGGYVHRGAALPALRGHYLYGDFCTGETWLLRYEGGQLLTPPTPTGLPSGFPLSSFGQDGRGNVYVVDYSGSVSRIVAQ